MANTTEDNPLMTQTSTVATQVASVYNLLSFCFINLQLCNIVVLVSFILNFIVSTVDKGWFDNNKDYIDFNKKWEGNKIKQRISINPCNLKFKTENELLEIILNLVTKGDDSAKKWWLENMLTKDQMKFMYRETLAPMIINLLTSKENVIAYIKSVRAVQKKWSGKRGVIRRKLFLLRFDPLLHS